MSAPLAGQHHRKVDGAKLPVQAERDWMAGPPQMFSIAYESWRGVGDVVVWPAILEKLAPFAPFSITAVICVGWFAISRKGLEPQTVAILAKVFRQVLIFLSWCVFVTSGPKWIEKLQGQPASQVIEEPGSDLDGELTSAVAELPRSVHETLYCRNRSPAWPHTSCD